MKKEEIPEHVKMFLKKEGITLEELIKVKKANIERIKRLKPKFYATMSEYKITVNEEEL